MVLCSLKKKKKKINSCGELTSVLRTEDLENATLMTLTDEWQHEKPKEVWQ